MARCPRRCLEGHRSVRQCRPNPRCVTAHIASNGTERNGTSSNGSGFGWGKSATATRDMYVADLDLTQDFQDFHDDDLDTGRMVVPATEAVMQRQFGQQGLPPRDSENVAMVLRDNEALKGELQTVKTELQQSKLEIQSMQVQLADKERSLQQTKADLIETRMELQRTDEKLREVQDRLRTATNERSEYRRYLLEAQQELQQTRAELLDWSEGLVELKAVMEGLDEDLGELFGEGEYQTALSEAGEITAGMGQTSVAFNSLNALASESHIDREGAESIAAALRDLQELSAEVLKQAEEDRILFDL